MPGTTYGDVHGAKAAPSRLHSKPSAGSGGVKAKRADCTAVVSCGASVSFVANGSGVGGADAVGAGVAACCVGAGALVTGAGGVLVDGPGAGAGAAPDTVIVPAARQLLVSLL